MINRSREDYRLQLLPEAYEYRPAADVYDMHNPDNFCYCPVAESCRHLSQTENDAWDMEECWETCKDGMIL